MNCKIKRAFLRVIPTVVAATSIYAMLVAAISITV